MTKRIELLDVLRGFAILGTLGTNIWLFANAGNVNALLGDTNYQTELEHGLQQATLFFANGKFLGMLTILFGVGLELQYQSAKKHGKPFLPVYIWRSSLLFLDGLLHYALVIEFDILMGYALTAMLVAFIVTRGEKVMKTTMIIAGGLHILMISAVTAAIMLTPRAELENALGDFTSISQVYLNGTYFDGIVYRLQHMATLRIEPIFVIPMGIAMFLFGVFLMRAGAFSEKGSYITDTMMKWGLGLGVPLNLLALEPSFGLDIAARYLFAPLQAAGYIGLVAYALRQGWLNRIASSIALVGRMALSNYMLQGVLASILFYGWGFGLAAQPNAYLAFSAWIAISLSLVIFSRLWLGRYKQGPFETVWKILSDMPFKEKKLEKTVRE